MGSGAEDWVNSVVLTARDADGTKRYVRINAVGRLEAVILGAIASITANVTVEQDDSIRQVQGTEGENLRTIAVDSSGQIIMVPRGQSGYYLNVDESGFMTTIVKGAEGETLRTLAVNANGQLIVLIQGEYGETLKTIVVDSSGQIIMVPRGQSGYYLDVDSSGFMSAILKGTEGENIRSVAVNSSGQLIAVIQGAIASITANVTVEQDDSIRQVQGAEGENLRTIAVDSSGQIIMVPRGQSGYYLDVDASGFMSAILKGTEGENIRSVAVNSAGQLITVIQGDYGGTLKTALVDADGRMETVVKGTKDVTRGLRLWYKFNPKEGVNIQDSSAWGYDAVAYSGVSEAVVYTDGVIGQGILFDGDNDFLLCGAGTALEFPINFSLECWVSFKTLPDVFHTFICKAENYKGYILWQDSDGYIIFVLGKGSSPWFTLTSASTYTETDHLYHIVATNDDGHCRLYVDGELAAGPSDSAAVAATANDLEFGRHYDGALDLQGLLDEIRIYAVGLTADEVAIRYNLTKEGGTGTLQEIAVNTRGQIEVQARDANALIRNLLVDTAGRLIIVPRGESGYYVDVDASGYTTTIMKGIEGANLRTLAVDTGGRLIALIKGIHDSTEKTIATDADGKMLATVRNLPYEDTLLLQYDDSILSGNDGWLNSIPVPSGKIWVVTNWTVFSVQDTFGRIYGSIKRGTDQYWIFFVHDIVDGVGSWYSMTNLILKAGDILRADFDTAAGNTDIEMHINGYILPAYT